MPRLAGGSVDGPDCCSPGPDPRIARHFDRHLGSVVDRGELPRLHSTSRALLDQLGYVRDLAPTVIELGSGSGAMTVALLERGAARARGIDLSPRSVEAARRRAETAAVGDRATFAVGDGAALDLEPHDWVVLDRVICCYRDADRLLANSMAAARSRYAFSVPVSRGLRGLVNRTVVTLENATNRLRGSPCPGYVHDVEAIERRLVDSGLRRRSKRTAGLWYLAVFERPEVGSGTMTPSVDDDRR